MAFLASTAHSSPLTNRLHSCGQSGVLVSVITFTGIPPMVMWLSMVHYICNLFGAPFGAGGYNCRMSALQKLHRNGIVIDPSALSQIARRYSITEIPVLGSSISDHPRIQSDVDLLVSFAPDAAIYLFDLMDLEKDLAQIFQRPADIVEPKALTNPEIHRNIVLCPS